MKLVKRIAPNVKNLNVKFDAWNCANFQNKLQNWYEKEIDVERVRNKLKII